MQILFCFFVHLYRKFTQNPNEITMRTIFNYLMILSLFTLNACGQSTKKPKTTAMENTINKPGNPYYSNTDTTKLNVSDAEWKKVLSPNLYAVSKNADT